MRVLLLRTRTSTQMQQNKVQYVEDQVEHQPTLCHKVSHVQYHLDALESGYCTQHAELVFNGHCGREALRVDHVRVQACEWKNLTIRCEN